MLRLHAFVIVVCLSASTLARADNPADTEKEARFNSHVRMGDLARFTGRYDDAATAYKAALDLQPNPAVSGRLGLVLMKLGQLDKAAEELHEAVERGQGVALHERANVQAAYDKAKALTTWVTVNVSQIGVRVTCDGEPWSREGFTTFWRFSQPGEHTLRAQLDGYEDAVETFTAKPGEEISVTLKLVPLVGPKLPELPPPVAASPPEARTFPPWLRSSNIATDPNYSPHEDPFYADPKESKPAKPKSLSGFSVNGGIVTVFGVASWNPAIGAVVGVAMRPKEFLSFGLEGRAAWLTTGIAGRPINAMTAGGILAACGHVRWFFGCGLGHLGAINLEFSDVVYTGKSYSLVQPGFGGRVGAEARFGPSAILRGNIDVLGMSRGIELRVENRVIASQAPVSISAQVSGGWEF